MDPRWLLEQPPPIPEQGRAACSAAAISSNSSDAWSPSPWATAGARPCPSTTCMCDTWARIPCEPRSPDPLASFPPHRFSISTEKHAMLHAMKVPLALVTALASLAQGQTESPQPRAFTYYQQAVNDPNAPKTPNEQLQKDWTLTGSGLTSSPRGELLLLGGGSGNFGGDAGSRRRLHAGPSQAAEGTGPGRDLGGPQRPGRAGGRLRERHPADPGRCSAGQARGPRGAAQGGRGQADRPGACCITARRRRSRSSPRSRSRSAPCGPSPRPSGSASPCLPSSPRSGISSRSPPTRGSSPPKSWPKAPGPRPG